MEAQTARCDECRADVRVPSDYAHGDKIRCDRCKAQLRVLRNEMGATRLVMADSGPLRATVEQNRTLLLRLEADLRTARHSFGIGVNGLLFGLLYVVYEIARANQPLTAGLLVTALVIALVTGVLLELSNHLFLAKRKAIERLKGEIEELRQSQRQLQARIREADRPHTKPGPVSTATEKGAAATR